MRNVICVWNNGHGEFEKNIPLEFIAKRNEMLGFNSEVDVVVLSGFDKFKPGYKENLLRLKFRLIDCTKLYEEAKGKNYTLARFGDYELKCFLRWIVLHEYFNNEPLIHYDGDVVFNENPDLISRLLAGKTFILQGCPAFTCIGDPQGWHEAYSSALEKFIYDIESYSIDAWRKREGWEQSEKEKWAGQRFRKIISSDQDFISHLIHTEQIKQDSPKAITDILTDYTMFENPLFISSYHPWNYTNCSYSRVNGIDFINSKKVFFWHMQTQFANYLSKFMLMRSILHCADHKVMYEAKANYDFINVFADILKRVVTYSRLDVYKNFFDSADFSTVFRNEVWWNSGVFK